MKRLSKEYTNLRKFSVIRSLVYEKNGEPLDVLQIKETKFRKLTPNEVLIKQLASPIHNSAINMIQGVYGIKTTLPSVAGNESVGEVVELGPDVSNLKVGDRVSTILQEIGTWSSHVTCPELHLAKIPKELDPFSGSVAFTNPASALLMLENFVKLNQDDLVVQNASTSAVGIYIIQICKIIGLRSINVFRDRDSLEANEETKKFLFDSGAFQVYTQTEFDLLLKERKLPMAKLGLNCVGGKPSVSILKSLEKNGCMVSYGAMSKQPTPLPVSPLIFKNIQVRGFWCQLYLMKYGYDSKEVQDLRSKLINWFLEGKLKPSPYTTYSLDQFREAFTEEPKQNSIGLKKIFKL